MLRGGDIGVGQWPTRAKRAKRGSRRCGNWAVPWRMCRTLSIKAPCGIRSKRGVFLGKRLEWLLSEAIYLFYLFICPVLSTTKLKTNKRKQNGVGDKSMGFWVKRRSLNPGPVLAFGVTILHIYHMWLNIVIVNYRKRIWSNNNTGLSKFTSN